MTYDAGQCKNEIPGNFNQSTCCCTIGKAFSKSCESCPARNTDDYQNLCGKHGFVDIDGTSTGKFFFQNIFKFR